MKKIALGGVVGLLLGLGLSLIIQHEAAKEPLLVQLKRLFQGPLSDHDNSPILIGDGSIHIKHGKAARSHFKNTATQIQATSYHPLSIGYECDPDAGKCTASDCAKPPGIPTSKCSVDLSTASWSLALCNGAPSCSGSGDVNIAGSGTSDTMTAIANNGGSFTYPVPGVLSTTGAEAVYGANDNNHLTSATLTVGADSYPFTCHYQTNKVCLTFKYYCDNGSCQ